MSSPFRPCMRLGPPASPLAATKRRLRLKLNRVFRPRSARKIMLPPWPASPPSGPPSGTYFSRRKCMAPLPPSPERTNTRASSRNVCMSSPHERRVTGKCEIRNFGHKLFHGMLNTDAAFDRKAYFLLEKLPIHVQGANLYQPDFAATEEVDQRVNLGRTVGKAGVGQEIDGGVQSLAARQPE